ncbi:MAG: ABC transporter permease subunit [Clostridia bacterium]|nr:ABC transporter permease subunit [Clostridia bacterium]
MMLNPIFESSARRRMRTVKTPAIVTAYAGVMAGLAFSQMTPFLGSGTTVGAMRLGVECYIWMTALQLMLIILVAPALSAVSIAGERERQTFDLLLVTGVGPWSIVWGKLMENFAFLALLILCGAPAMALSIVTGGVSLADIALTLLALMLIAFAALSVGMVVSTLTRRSITAIISAYLAVLAIGALSWGLAKHGPLAARYSYESLRQLAQLPTWRVIAGMPPTIFLNPAVALVTLLASQTGILHTTMESTLRLFDIYSAFRAAGFGQISMTCFAAIALASAMLAALSVLILRAQTGAGRARPE